MMVTTIVRRGAVSRYVSCVDCVCAVCLTTALCVSQFTLGPLDLVANLPSAWVQLGLFLYSSLVFTTASLLHCVPLDVTGQTHKYLFLAGSTQCYTWWQRVLFAVMGLLCVTPLGVLYMTYYSPLQHGIPRSSTRATTVAHIVLESPYQPRYRWWEGVLLGQLLALVLVHVFVSDPGSRLCALTLVAVVALFLQAFAAPYRKAKVNLSQSFFLMCWAALGVVNMPEANSMSLAASEAQERRLPPQNSLEAVRYIVWLVPILLFVSIRAWQHRDKLFS